MNLKEILFIARSRLRDLGVSRFSEAELIASINEGICDMSSIIRQAREDYFLTSTTSTVATAVAPNPSVMVMPDDFLELKDLWVLNQGFEDIDFIAADRTTKQYRRALLDGGSFGSGSGVIYYDIYGNSTIQFAPGFDVALTIRVDYIQTVPDLAMPADVPSLIPTKWHNDIPDYAVAEALRSVGDKRWRIYTDKVKDSEKTLQAGIQPRQVREGKFVTGYMESDEY
jgi:hypothetical protein